MTWESRRSRTFRASNSSTELKQRILKDVASTRVAMKLFRYERPTWFISLTFRDQTDSAMTGRARFKCWLSTWSRSAELDPFRFLLWSAEKHRMGSVHIHALSVGPVHASFPHCVKCRNASSRSEAYQRLKESWAIHHGWARFFPYRDDIGRGGMAYVAKYILSPACLDWDIWHNGKDY
jgi:hypothetical protein